MAYFDVVLTWFVKSSELRDYFIKLHIQLSAKNCFSFKTQICHRMKRHWNILKFGRFLKNLYFWKKGQKSGLVCSNKIYDQKVVGSNLISSNTRWKWCQSHAMPGQLMYPILVYLEKERKFLKCPNGAHKKTFWKKTFWNFFFFLDVSVWCQFINILSANFLYACLFGSFSLVTCKWKKLPKTLLYIKLARKMLMKLTPGANSR